MGISFTQQDDQLSLEWARDYDVPNLQLIAYDPCEVVEACVLQVLNRTPFVGTLDSHQEMERRFPLSRKALEIHHPTHTRTASLV